MLQKILQFRKILKAEQREPILEVGIKTYKKGKGEQSSVQKMKKYVFDSTKRIRILRERGKEETGSVLQ